MIHSRPFCMVTGECGIASVTERTYSGMGTTEPTQHRTLCSLCP
ncbi:rCG51607 [Rattus norvegicus]|uniref:RCG51607 n=1 Tax=Rattus norvegicus TaxID=10116 RepID=A6IZV0_RAT|nr:rCG51607 [Rattus norvegicus]